MIRGMCSFLSVTFLFTTAKPALRRPSVPPPSLFLPLPSPPNLFPRPDTGFFYASVHEARLGRRGITYKKTLTIVRRSQLCCCAICTRTVRNLKILIVTGARVAQYRVTHAWPNWIVMNKTGVKNNYSQWVDIPFEIV